jgi:uncharacterized protein YcfL
MKRLLVVLLLVSSLAMAEKKPRRELVSAQADITEGCVRVTDINYIVTRNWAMTSVNTLQAIVTSSCRQAVEVALWGSMYDRDGDKMRDLASFTKLLLPGEQKVMLLDTSDLRMHSARITSVYVKIAP